jgi:hypothetical protein
MADLAQWGELLQGIGAGFSGQGTQYMQAKAQAEFLNDERRRKAMIRDFATVYSLGQAGQWDTAARLLQNRIGDVQRLGGDPKDTMALYEHIADPAKREAGMAELGAFIQAGVLAGDIDAGRGNSPSQFSGMNMMTDGQRMFMVTGVNDPNTGQVSPSVVAVDGSGVAPQGPLQLVNNIGLTANQIPGQKGAEAYATADARGNAGYQWAGPTASAEAQARANVEAATAPKIAADTTAAQEEAKADVERKIAQRGNAVAFDAYQQAMNNIRASFGKTNTGPVAGRMPAVTAGQQTAEGAVAAAAPVLKQLFRSAGEGVFTDKDQQLLIDMLPKRTDHPEVVESKLQMVDAVVAAKLNMGNPQAQTLEGPVTVPRETPRRRKEDQSTGFKVLSID